MPRNREALWDIAQCAVSLACEERVLDGKPIESKRFAVYMAFCFAIGKKSMKMLSTSMAKKLKKVVRASEDYNTLMST